MTQKNSDASITDVLRNTRSPSFTDESDLESRVGALLQSFTHEFGSYPELIVRSPGRAEILGNHTDYNQGYALAASISRSILALMRKRDDRLVRIRSDAYAGEEVTFSIDKPEADKKHRWTNYARAVINELVQEGFEVGGADILLGSNLPGSGGVSSSAALELAIAVGMSGLYGKPLSQLEAALLCKRAENGPLVGTPCGLLDQAAVAFGESGKMVFLDFLPQGKAPLGIEVVQAGLAARGCSFVITVDPGVKRNLGDTGYPARRRMCEESLPLLSELLGREVPHLRSVSVPQFEGVVDLLEKRGGVVMRKRVEHIVRENQRVLDGTVALGRGDARGFGALLTQSGHSALELYDLAEKTPELTFLVERQRELPGVIGTRNMGGGFSAITLSLLEKGAVPAFTEGLETAYREKYGRPLRFLEFQSTQGVEIL